MSSNLVIAAVPDENDRVWKVSSEKVPHLTLLFLGETNSVTNLDQIMLFVEHAADTTLRRFYLSVDRRGELGADQADVLFFRKGFDYRVIRDFRSALLKDNNIKTAYDSATQFEGPWQPHLTLGYPASPAKEADSDFGFFDVAFNKIAVWTGDFEGVDFLLKSYDEEIDLEPMDISMSDARVANLQHHGVKGQKWGVRKEEVAGGGHIRISEKTGQAVTSTSSQFLSLAGPFAFASPRFRSEVKAAGAHNREQRAVKKAARKDKKWTNQIYTTSSAVKVHNAMADHFNERIDALNSKPDYKGMDLIKRPDDATAKKYYADVNRLTMEGYKQAVATVHGSSPSGRKQAVLSEDGESIKIVDTNKVKHAATDEDIVFLLKRDANDRILEMNKAELSPIRQSIDVGAEFLAHHGVKGMKWGVRKEDLGGAAKKVGSALKTAAKATGRAADNTAFELNKNKEWVSSDITEKAAEKLGGDLPAIKARHGDYGKLSNRIKKPFSKEARAYRADVKSTYLNHLESSANEITNLRGTRQYTLSESGKPNTSQYFWSVSTKAVQHADPGTVRVRPIFDSEGWIVKVETIDDSMSQSVTELGATMVSSLFDDEALAHHGIKGMRWGMRRAREAPVTVHPMGRSRVPHGDRRKTKIDVQGGQNHPAHADAVKVAEAKTKLKKSGTAALSNQELRDLRDRIQLEQQVAGLMTRRGRKTVQRQLEVAGQETFKKGVSRGIAKTAAKKGGTAALLFA